MKGAGSATGPQWKVAALCGFAHACQKGFVGAQGLQRLLNGF